MDIYPLFLVVPSRAFQNNLSILTSLSFSFLVQTSGSLGMLPLCSSKVSQVPPPHGRPLRDQAKGIQFLEAPRPKSLSHDCLSFLILIPRAANLEKEVAGLREKIHHLDDMLKSQQRKVRQMIEQVSRVRSYPASVALLGSHHKEPGPVFLSSPCFCCSFPQRAWLIFLYENT